jgi:hypothetical protein
MVVSIKTAEDNEPYSYNYSLLFITFIHAILYYHLTKFKSFIIDIIIVAILSKTMLMLSANSAMSVEATDILPHKIKENNLYQALHVNELNVSEIPSLWQ